MQRKSNQINGFDRCFIKYDCIINCSFNSSVSMKNLSNLTKKYFITQDTIINFKCFYNFFNLNMKAKLKIAELFIKFLYHAWQYNYSIYDIVPFEVLHDHQSKSKISVSCITNMKYVKEILII